MTSTPPAWISPHGYERLQRELAGLRMLHSSANVDGQPDDNAIAVPVVRPWTSHCLKRCRTGFTGPV